MLRELLVGKVKGSSMAWKELRKAGSRTGEVKMIIHMSNGIFMPTRQQQK